MQTAALTGHPPSPSSPRLVVARSILSAVAAWGGLCVPGQASTALEAAEAPAATQNSGGTVADAGTAVAGGGKVAYRSRGETAYQLVGMAVGPPAWQAPVDAGDSQLNFSVEEQQELLAHLKSALEALTTASPDASGPAAPAVPPAPGAVVVVLPRVVALRLEARITQASMPNLARNWLVMALPIPVPGVRSLLRSRGGAGIEVALLREGEAEPLARFECEHQVGLISVLDSYRRLAQAKTAMDRCAAMLARSAPEGRLVEVANTTTNHNATAP